MTASSTTLAAADTPAPRVVAGATFLHVLVEMFEGCVNNVTMYDDEQLALAEYEKVTGGVSWDEVHKDRAGDEADPYDDAGWAGTTIYDKLLSIRDCETPGCLGFSINEGKVAENHCVEHRKEVLLTPVEVSCDACGFKALEGSPAQQEHGDQDGQHNSWSEPDPSDEDPRLRRNIDAFVVPMPPIDPKLAALQADLPQIKSEQDEQDMEAGSYQPGGEEEDEEDLDFDLNDVVERENAAAEALTGTETEADSIRQDGAREARGEVA